MIRGYTCTCVGAVVILQYPLLSNNLHITLLSTFSHTLTHTHTHTHTHSGLYQNPVSHVCEPCDTQCLGGCTNGMVRLLADQSPSPSSPPSPSTHPHCHHILTHILQYITSHVWNELLTLSYSHHYTHSLPHPCTPSQGPEHCNQCRNYYIEEVLGAGSAVRVCVETCSQGTYLNTTSRQCIPCHEACLGGCAGPLPFVNRTFGCLECDRVELDREGRQVSLGEMILNTQELDHSLFLPPSLPPSLFFF